FQLRKLLRCYRRELENATGITPPRHPTMCGLARMYPDCAQRSHPVRLTGRKSTMHAVQPRTLLVFAVRVTLTVLAATAIGCSTKTASPKNIYQTFEDSDEGWIPFGPDAQVEVTKEGTLVRNGSAALALHYSFHPGQYGSAVLPIERGQLSKLSRIQFWI